MTAEPERGIWGDTAWTLALPDKLFDAFHLYIAICLGEQLVESAALGGAIYLAGQVLVMFARLYSKRNSPLLPAGIQARGLLLFISASVLSACLLLLYPALLGHENFSALMGCIGLLLLRQATSAAVYHLNVRRTLRILILITIYAILSVAVTWIAQPLLSGEAFGEIVLMVFATGVAGLAYHAAQSPREVVRPRADADKLNHVSAYRIYNRMTSSAVTALNLALLSYICYVRIKPQESMLQVFWDITVWLLLVGGLTVLMLRLLGRRVTRYDKPSVFAAGAALILLAIVGAYKGWFTGWMTPLSYLLWGAGLACMFSIMLSLGHDMRQVLELDMTNEELEGYRDNTRAVTEWSLTLFTLLLVLLLTLISFFARGRAETWLVNPIVQWALSSMLFWPPVLVAAALIYALMQPLNRDYARKLAHYRAQQRINRVNPALRTRLQMKLIQQSRRFAPDILRFMVRPLMPCRIIGAEQVDIENGPVVFVCNHLEIYGPLITNLHLPFYFRSWIISNMLDRDAIAEHLTGGVEAVFRFLPRRLRDRLPKLLAPVILFVLRSLDPIPVFRGSVRDVINTIKQTVDAMEYEDNILLFPENPTEKYLSKGVSDFFSGFASIGAEYYKRTGDSTTFYPMYADKSRRTLTIGAGITYNPQNGRLEEKERIVSSLHEWMAAQADE